MVESYEEIRRMLEQDERHMKKIGSNIHRKTGKGSERAGVRGDLRGKSKFDKPYSKNSRVLNYKLPETVIKHDEFKKFDSDTQREIMYEWLARFTLTHIRVEMGVGINGLHNILSNLNIDRQKGEEMKLSNEDMKKYKEDFIPVRLFKQIRDCDKFELVDYYQQSKGMSNSEIADKLGYNINTFNSNKTDWRKAYESEVNNDMEYNDDFLVEDIGNKDKPNTKTKPKQAKKQDTKPKVVENDYSNETEANNAGKNAETIDDLSVSLVIQGVSSGQHIKESLNAITGALDNEKRYNVSIKVEEARDE